MAKHPGKKIRSVPKAKRMRLGAKKPKRSKGKSY